MKKNMLMMVGYFLLIALITGCSQDNQVNEQVLEKLEKAAELETEFANLQEPLVDLEKREQALYDQMKELGLGEIDQIITLANEATSYAEERKALIEKESASIEASYEKYKEITTLINEIEDEELQGKLSIVMKEMDSRYDSYLALHEKYNLAIELDKEFYVLFQAEDLKLEEVKEIIDRINSNYEKILQLKDEFNAYTHAYNDAKINYYQAAELNVVVKDEGTEE
jgi:hypothetical protein